MYVGIKFCVIAKNSHWDEDSWN